MIPLDALALAPAAFLAGVFMFLAPCTLPLVPSYLAFIAGVPYGQVGKGGSLEARQRILLNAVAFIIGFSFVFMVLGMFAGLAGSLLGPWREYLSRAAGLVVMLFGFTMMGVLRIRFFLSERRLALPRFLTVGRPESSILIGALFALGWSPCVGPILGTVLLFASARATALEGGLLLSVFSLGLGLPFLLSALLIGRASKAFARLTPALEWLSLFGGGVLVFFGALLFSGMIGSLVPSSLLETHLFGYQWLLHRL